MLPGKIPANNSFCAQKFHILGLLLVTLPMDKMDILAVFNTTATYIVVFWTHTLKSLKKHNTYPLEKPFIQKPKRILQKPQTNSHK